MAQISILWRFMFWKDDLILATLSSLMSLKSYLSPSLVSLRMKMKNLPKEGVGRNIYIILNGPSLKKQDISVLKGKDVMFVNRGFLHKDYEILQPKYHIFEDTKMLNGIWPTDWFDEIWKKSPQTKIVLPYAWYAKPRFEPYRNNEKVYWLPWYVPFHSLGVAGSCFSLAILQKYSKAFFTGFDANAPAFEMLQMSESHFYGEDSELKGRNSLQFALSLYMHGRHLRDWYRMGDYVKKTDTQFFNMTEGGMIDSFPRISLLEASKL